MVISLRRDFQSGGSLWNRISFGYVTIPTDELVKPGIGGPHRARQNGMQIMAVEGTSLNVAEWELAVLDATNFLAISEDEARAVCPVSGWTEVRRDTPEFWHVVHEMAKRWSVTVAEV